MPAIPLPDEPSLDQLRNQAKDLRRAVLAGEPGALAEAADSPSARPVPAARRAAVVARRYGFPSWARLKRHVQVIEHYSRFPDRVTGDGAASLADRFLRLASLCYADDQPERWAQGRRLLAEHPEITSGQRARGRRGGRHRGAAAPPGRRPRRRPPRGRPVPVAAAVLPGLRPARPADRRGRRPDLRPAPAGRRRRPERRLPLARPAHPVHRADRGVRRRGTGPGPPAPAPALARPRPPAAASRRRPERRPGALQPDVRAR